MNIEELERLTDAAERLYRIHIEGTTQRCDFNSYSAGPKMAADAICEQIKTAAPTLYASMTLNVVPPP